jgi:eukaryotic-like serine/threonine-protein kinase
MLAGRYELGRIIGRGGMAEVHAAHDRLLDREVAVKLLRARFREDAAFTARFHDEARHVARLAHPNLVVVHDTGTEDGEPYIVMERIRGRTLQQAIDAGGLTEDRALQVSADVCGALGYAHRNGLVHRDVKPGNIMLAEDGSVKVTDFGIARAISDETVTVTAAVLGTAAYLSPEQAQGRRVDARSDLYSLGIVLYELLTGSVPFTGESAVAVALQHVRATPEAPRRLRPAVTRGAETIALRLLEKDPDRRYQQADDVRVDLERARRGEPPLPLRAAASRRSARAGSAGARDGADDGPGPDDTADARDTRALATAGVVPSGAAEGAWSAAGDGRYPDADGNDGLADPSLDTDASAGPRVAARLAREARDDRERSRRLAGYAAFVAVLLAVGIGVRALITAEPPPPPDVTVPAVVGLTLDDALDALAGADLRLLRLLEAERDDVAPGTVVAQLPAGGATVPSGSGVDVTVARAPTLTTVPSVAGLPEAEALRRLRESGLTPGPLVREPDPGSTAGTVLRIDPGPGRRVPVGTVVTVVVSEGPELLPVRSVTNLALPDAVARLRDQGFLIDVYEEPNPAVVPGSVIRQVPAAGERAAPGTTVMLWVSTGADGSAPLPDVPDAPPPSDATPPEEDDEDAAG